MVSEQSQDVKPEGSFAIVLTKRLLLLLEGVQYIIPFNMKGVWIAIMLGSEGGFFLSLIQGFDRYEKNIWVGIFFWALAALAVALAVYAFVQASKIGKREDEIAMGR